VRALDCGDGLRDDMGIPQVDLAVAVEIVHLAVPVASMDVGASPYWCLLVRAIPSPTPRRQYGAKA
jgi:hypothetical protein